MSQGSVVFSFPRVRRTLIFNLGAGNSFLGGLAAGLTYSEGDVYEGEMVPNIRQMPN